MTVMKERLRLLGCEFYFSHVLHIWDDGGLKEIETLCEGVNNVSLNISCWWGSKGSYFDLWWFSAAMKCY